MEAIQHPCPIIQESLEHGFHVALCAKALFQGLAHLHGLKKNWENILIVGARLHDIGWLYGKKAHHKNSASMIRTMKASELPERMLNVFEAVFKQENPNPAFFNDIKTRTLVSLVARYHRRADPSPQHTHFAALSTDEQSAITKLAAIIRLADALDFSHTACVQEVHVHVQKHLVRLDLCCEHDCHAEIARIQDKKHLFTRIFSRDVQCQHS